jgi:hypothetical protein
MRGCALSARFACDVRALLSLPGLPAANRSAFAPNALTEADRVSLLSGNPEPITVPTPSGKPHEIYRCRSCRVALWSTYGGVQKLRFVRIGTLDDSATLRPDVHIYVRSKLPWITLPKNVPAFEAYYDSRKLSRRKPRAAPRDFR